MIRAILAISCAWASIYAADIVSTEIFQSSGTTVQNIGIDTCRTRTKEHALLQSAVAVSQSIGTLRSHDVERFAHNESLGKSRRRRRTTKKDAATTDVADAKSWELFQLILKLRKTGYTCPDKKEWAPNSKALVFDCKIYKLALGYSKAMATEDFFGDFSGKRDPFKVAEAVGVWISGVNIGVGSSPLDTLDMWMDDASQCNSIMNPKIHVWATGFWHDSDSEWGDYWTAMQTTSGGETDKTCYPDGADASPAQRRRRNKRRKGRKAAKINFRRSWELFHLMNNLRRKGYTCPSKKKWAPNPKSATFDCKLYKVTLGYSRAMAKKGFFGDFSGKRDPLQRAAKAGISAAGVHIDGGKSASAVLKGWKANKEQCDILMDPEIDIWAIGFFNGGKKSREGTYWTSMYRTLSKVEKTLGEELDKSCYPA